MEKSEKKLKIFLVDDDKWFSKWLKRKLLNNRGDRWEVSLFATGEDCIKNLNQKPQVVVLDYYLDSNCPNAKNGVEILKKIKTISSTIDVVFLSSQNQLNVSLNAMNNGAYDFLTKERTSSSKLLQVIYTLERRWILSKTNSNIKWIFRSVTAGLFLLLIGLYFLSKLY